MQRLAILTAFLAFAVGLAFVPYAKPAEAQNCYGTGFCIQNPAFLSYYRGRGEEKSLGFPISNEFTLEGFQVQIFQRVVLQSNLGNVARLNLLDNDVMPITRANQSVFPGPDPSLASTAPAAGSANYAQAVVAFVQQVSPNSFNNLPVRFFDKFMGTVPPQPGANNDIMTLLNLEIWGVPTSKPATDPGNGGFIYQRYQRGIMHYQKDPNVTEGILIGEYFKAVLTGVNLPGDLDADMRNSRYYRQYNPGAQNSVNRPAQLQNTNLTNAFGSITPPPGPAPAPAGATPTVTATTTAAASVIIQVSDSRIDPGQMIEITVIANDPKGLDVIQWEGVLDDKKNLNDNQAKATDPELDRHEFDCEGNTACAHVFAVSPTVAGDYLLRARARNKDAVRTEWVSTPLRIRVASGTATPTTGPTATATTAPPPGSPSPRQ